MIKEYPERIKNYRIPEDLDKINREFFLYSAEKGAVYEKNHLQRKLRIHPEQNDRQCDEFHLEKFRMATASGTSKTKYPAAFYPDLYRGNV